MTLMCYRCGTTGQDNLIFLNDIYTKNTNTNNFILHRIKNSKTLATSYFSMVNMSNIIQLFTIKLI